MNQEGRLFGQGRRRNGIAAACICAALIPAGCVGGRSFELAQEAERRGDASKAYDEYVKAGTRSQAGAIEDAISRVAPAAADEAESAALAAMDAGDHADAWRMLMRTLEIQPNHPNAPQLIRRIEAEHAGDIAAAKADYVRRGFAALAMTRRPPTQLAAAGKGAGNPTLSETSRDKSPAPPPKPAIQGPPRIASAPPPPKAPTPPPAAPTRTEEKVAVAAPSRRVMPTPAPRREVLPPTALNVPPPQEAEAPPTSESEREDEDEEAAELPEFEGVAPEPVVMQHGAGKYAMMYTLSKRDRRYPRTCRTVDGITITLKDTDDDMEADFDLYSGNRRIKKIRDLELGRAQTFRGKSGELYRLTLLGVHDESHTVRIGIKPA